MNDELNPYAPPEAEVGGSRPVKKTKKKKAVSGEIAEAIERLNERLANPENVAADREQAGGKLRPVTIVFVIFVVLIIGGLITLAGDRGGSNDAIKLAVALVSLLFGGLAIALVAIDLRTPLRDTPLSPEKTLQFFFKAISLGRLGYAWVALCPTAREQTVEAPALGPIPVGPGSFTLDRLDGFKRYLMTFARPGTGQMRTMQVKRVTLLREDSDIAEVEVVALFQAWPQWAQIVAVVGFVLIRVLGAILFLVLFLALRKTQEVTFRKTLIRGSNNVWYVYSGDLLDGAKV